MTVTSSRRAYGDRNSKLVFTIALCLLLSSAQAQEIVIDPVASSTAIINGQLENKSLNDIKEKQLTIQNLQATTAATVNFINSWQKKTYEGLQYVSSTVKNVYQVYECYKVLKSIYENESKMIEEAKQNPLALAFALKAQGEMISRAIGFYGEIQTLILKEGDKNLLMDAGERITLMNNILLNLSVINGYAYSSYLKVRLVVRQGIINSLNPFAGFVNQDARLVKETITKWKF